MGGQVLGVRSCAGSLAVSRLSLRVPDPQLLLRWAQNSKLVKALQDSGLATETGAERVGVFGLENVRSPTTCPRAWEHALRSPSCALWHRLALTPLARRRVAWRPQYGNTCYCNSVLQALYFCKPFREKVSNYRPKWLAEGEKVRPAPSAPLGIRDPRLRG
jgi:hypothetical protein